MSVDIEFDIMEDIDIENTHVCETLDRAVFGGECPNEGIFVTLMNCSVCGHYTRWKCQPCLDNVIETGRTRHMACGGTFAYFVRLL